MEWFQDLSPVHLLLSLVVPLGLWLLLSTRGRQRGRPKLPLPPGPPGLPIIGHMLMVEHLSHRGLAKLAEKYGGLFHLQLGFLHTVTVSTPEMARHVLQAQDIVFSNRPNTIASAYLSYDRADMVTAHYGPFWRKLRKLCVVKLFSRRHAESWASARDEVDVAVAQTAAAAGTPVNIGALVSNLTMNITYRAAFGARNHEEQEEFITILEEFSKLFTAINIADFIPRWPKWIDVQGLNKRMKTARASLDRFIDRVIDGHINNPKATDAPEADMVDEMIAFLGEPNRNSGEDTGEDDLKGSLRLNRDNIKGIIMDVMFGGTETVASVIEWALAELLRSPEELKRVQQELADVVGLDRKVHETDLDRLPYLKYTVKETLRLHPPIPVMQHESAEDCTVAGYSVPVRTRVMVNTWAIGRDKSAWKDPDEFRPSRFAPGGEGDGVDFRGNFFQLIPFGSGRRSCPGMQLGLYSAELALAQLLHCFTWALPDGMKPADLDMQDVLFGLTAPKAVRLVAVPTQRITCPLL